MKSIREYLQSYEEDIPSWIIGYVSGKHVKLSEVFKNRIAYYPGSRFDGNLITVVNKAQAAHVFLYVDYGVTREELDAHLESPHCMSGYHIVGQTEYALEDFNDVCHYLPPEKANRIGMFDSQKIKPYCLMTVFERNEDKDDGWGSKRFVLLFLCADGIATYYHLFVEGSVNAPWIFMLQDHGFGGNYDKFGKGGLLDQIISRSHERPKYVICDEYTHIWDGYKKVENLFPTYGGMHHDRRVLYSSEDLLIEPDR